MEAGESGGVADACFGACARACCRWQVLLLVGYVAQQVVDERVSCCTRGTRFGWTNADGGAFAGDGGRVHRLCTAGLSGESGLWRGLVSGPAMVFGYMLCGSDGLHA